jgi:DedD protein
MAFFKFRKRGSQGGEGRNAAIAAPPAESVEAMRRRARHRLLGAAVLVLIGVIGFPLLFDTQPRPVDVDIPIEIPDRNKVKPLAPSTGPESVASAPAAAPAGNAGMITEAADGTEIVPPPAAPEIKPEPAPKPKPEARTETRPAPKPAAPKPATADDGDRARALLEGRPPAAATAKPAAAEDSGRFIVQAGAFADADKVREVRQKLERAGLKTYIHIAQTPEGERTRVRVGPFNSRAEADKVAAKVKSLSLQAAVLSL